MSFDCSNVDVEDFLECLEVDFTDEGDQVRFPCPFHQGLDNNCRMNKDNTTFICFVCKASGNAISFTQKILQVSPLEAIRMLKQRYQPGGLNPDAVSMVEEVGKIFNASEPDEIPQPQLPESALDKFAMDWVEAWCEWMETHHDTTPWGYILSRGFQPETLEDWEFGYDFISDRITFAVRDEHGKLVGFKARAYDGRQPKYLVLGDKPNKQKRYGWPCYFPSRVLFGAHRLEMNSEVVVCEGEFNAIAVTERTGRPAVAINGSWFSDHHAKILRHFASRVVLFLDDDKAGQEAVWGYMNLKGQYQPGIVERLKNFVPVAIVPRSESDAAEMSGDEINNLIERSESALLRSLGV